MKSNITINQKQDEITMKINENAEYDAIAKELKNKLKDLKKMYKEETTPIFITGKVLKNKEIEAISKIIKSEIDVELSFDSPTTLGLHSIKKTFEKDIKNSETKFYKGSVRSGQKIEFEGSIVIMGDLNGGAEVIAGENIAVVGSLRGLAHAGAKGNKKAVISAKNIEAPQVRIANVIKEIEKTEGISESKTFAYVFEDKIILE